MVKNVALILLSFLFLNSSLYASMDIMGYQSFIQWVISQQAGFHRELVALVRSIGQGGSTVLLWGLMVTSFFYGVFHAAGPGHGKAVISAYMLASKAPLRRGIGLAFLCAVMQAVMAILVILVLSQVFSLAGKTMQISRFLEVVSFAAVGLIGVWMLVRLLRGQSSCGHDHSHDHQRSHDHNFSHEHHDSHNDEHHDGQAILTEKKVARRSIWAMVLAVGIRPCTGAILVLLFSLTTGIFLWGIVATFAMAFGTAITVASLAGVSVFVRDTGFILSSGQRKWQHWLTRGFGFFAAFALIFVSVSTIWSYIDNARRAF